MKPLTTLLLILFCMSSLMAQRSISGEGPVVERELSISNFDGVKSGISGDVYLTQGSNWDVRIEGQDNIINNIEFDNRGGTLVIKNERGVRNAKRVKIYITMPDLKEASLSGSGTLVSTGLFKGLSHVDVALSGSGDVEINLEASEVEARVSGSGSVELSGSARGLGARISGSGQVHAYDFKIDDADISISGSGNAYVHSEQSIDARISGSGNVTYTGDAPKVYARVSGSGKVRSK